MEAMGDSNLATANGGIQEEQLNRAIEELRDVLHDGSAAPEEAGGGQQNTSLIMNIPVDLQIVLGNAEMPVSELMALRKGSTVALNRRIGEPVDVVVNGRKIAKGEITVLESDPSRFGIKLTEIATTAKPA
jgi:flagellar motor switch protein FliN/FliY